MKSILLIEDDPFIAEIYSTKLKEEGFEVDTVQEGKSAFKIIKEKKPDLLLLDVVLPNIDGWEILRKVKQTPELSHIKIIILSNLEERPEIEKGFQLGADKYLVKAHYTPKDVICEVKKVLTPEKRNA